MTLHPSTERAGGLEIPAPLPPPVRSDLIAIQPFDGPIDPFAEWAAPPSPTETTGSSDWPGLAAVLDADRTGFATLTGNGRAIVANEVFLETVGAESTDQIRPGTAPGGVVRSLLDHLPNELLEGGHGGAWHGNFDHTGGRTLRATVLVDAGSARPSIGVGARLSVLLHDVTDARRRIQELRHEATHDELTGLTNRPAVLAHLAATLDAHRGRPGHVAVLFLDLDHLKYVNDAFGHRAGDQLIAKTAQRLTQAVRPDDRVARIGGDEFLVVGTDVSDPMVALDLAERVRRALSGHLKVGDLDLEFSVSIGLAITDSDLLDLPSDEAAALLVAQADSAMYAAKQAGRGRSIIFTNRMRADARSRTETASQLARAVTDDSLTVEYQPVYSTVTGRAVSVEALVRWHHPRLGQMDPAMFISIAEESGVIGRLGEQVLTRSLDDLVDWRRSGRIDEQFSVHVNVSRVQLSSSRFVASILGALRERGLSPSQLVLEVRETSLLGRAADIDRSIRSLRRSGVQVAVDNFGSGPKALAVMTDVGADVLKLDGSLALPNGSTETDTRLVRAVVLLAHALEMNVVAERVTSAEQLERLRAAGCDMVQGHLLAEPTAPETLDLESPAW